MTQTAETYHIRKAPSEGVDHDQFYDPIGALLGESGTVAKPRHNTRRVRRILRIIRFALLLLALVLAIANLRADETCSSPYLARIEGQEEFVYVWTLGDEKRRRWLGQARHDRREARLAELRQSRSHTLRRRTARSASRRVHG